MNVITAPGTTGKTQVVFEPGQHNLNGVKWYAMSASAASGLTALTYGTAITTSAWTELTANGVEYTPASGDKYIRVIEVDSANKPIAVGDAVINLG